MSTATIAQKGTTYDCLRLENQICFPLYACAKELTRQYRKPLEEIGLTYTQYIAMMALWEFGSMTAGELGEKVHLDSGTLTPLLKRLEKQGLLTRTRLESNERKLMLSLTKKGEALKDAAAGVPSAMDGCIKLADNEIAQLKTLLDKALRSMEV
ncbi:MAG: MarR family transcriptional regulator [Eggerthellaceae bacterium]|nr:MarR family transcriptional regulator [Eggerthellaceae bacterium]